LRHFLVAVAGGAPSCSALRTSSRSMLAVRRIVRVASGTPLSVRSTSRPGRPGIARSSLVLSMGLARHPHFDARALTGRRFDGERAADRSHALLDDDRTLPADLEIRVRVPADESKPLTVVVDLELELIVWRADADDDVARAAVFADVDERFLDDARDLAADMRRQRHLVDLRGEMGGDAGLPLKPLGEIGEVLEEMARVDRQRPHVLNQIAQLDDLAPQHMLDVTEMRSR